MDYINFAFCIIFAKKPYAQDFIEKAAYFFASIEKIARNHQLDLHMALKNTIKYHFRGNDEKIKELLHLITKAIDQTQVDELAGYEVKQFTNQELKVRISNLEAEKAKSDEKVSDLEVKNSNLEAENSNLRAEKAKDDAEKAKLMAENKKQRKRIEELENNS